MHFEHLVEINDLGNPLATPLSRAQVWAGLLYRVEDARPFLPGLDRCDILRRDASGVDRRLAFGSTEVFDHVSLVDDDWVRFDTAATPTHGGGALTIAIEEPQPGALFLRFTYDTVFASGHEAEDEAYAGFLRQAYTAADIDTVRVIRELAVAVQWH